MRFHAGPVRLALLIAAIAVASPPPSANAAAQTVAPDPAAKIHVESVEVNLSQHPAFQFVVQIPTMLRFEAGDANGQRYLHIWAYSRVDSLETRIRKASLYLAAKPGIFTPLFETQYGTPIMGYVDRLQFGEAYRRALRDFNTGRTLSYNRRLT